MTIERGPKIWFASVLFVSLLYAFPFAARAAAQHGDSCYAQYEHALAIAEYRLWECHEHWINRIPFLPFADLDACEFRVVMETIEALATYFKCIGLKGIV